MPDGTFCGECSCGDCAECEVWKLKSLQKQRYINWKCPECGNELEI